jgi:hypothetical protein
VNPITTKCDGCHICTPGLRAAARSVCTDAGFYDPAESVTLCRACHRRVTAKRAAARKQGRA